MFYTRSENLIRDHEPLIEQLRRRGHRILYLNQVHSKSLTELWGKEGFYFESTDSIRTASTLLATLQRVLNFVFFVVRNKVDVVFSHLEPANFVAVLAQAFLNTRIVVFRHHRDLAALAGFDRNWSYKFTYRYAKEIVAVSESTRDYMVMRENVNRSKISVIHLGYDFQKATEYDRLEYQEIPSKRRDVKLITVGRLDQYKRPFLSVFVLRELVRQGIDAHLQFLGVGELSKSLEEVCLIEGLQERVSFMGYVNDVLGHLARADWLLHPSNSESSCVVVKEAAFVRTPVIVCADVGDFSEFLSNGETGVLVSIDDFVNEATRTIFHYLDNDDERQALGRRLYYAVTNRFDIRKVVGEYERFISK